MECPKCKVDNGSSLVYSKERYQVEVYFPCCGGMYREAPDRLTFQGKMPQEIHGYFGGKWK